MYGNFATELVLKKTKSSNNNETLSQKAVKGNILNKKNTLTWRASTLIKWTKYCMSSNIMGIETYGHHKPQKLSKENSYNRQNRLSLQT